MCAFQNLEYHCNKTCDTHIEVFFEEVGLPNHLFDTHDWLRLSVRCCTTIGESSQWALPPSYGLCPQIHTALPSPHTLFACDTVHIDSRVEQPEACDFMDPDFVPFVWRTGISLRKAPNNNPLSWTPRSCGGRREKGENAPRNTFFPPGESTSISICELWHDCLNREHGIDER